jgi:signal transduction histidine kinase/ActR/RegA family two-component response regulator
VTQSSSLRWKLTALIAAGSVIAAVIAAAGFSWWDLSRFWERTTAEVTAVSNIVADQVGPAVLLGDPKAAGEILASLRADNRIRDAVLYGKTGACFAEFHSGTVHACPTRADEGIWREPDALVISRRVSAGGERVGTLLLSARVPSLGAILRQYLRGAALIVFLSLVVAAILAAVLQARVSAPILAIAKVAQRMAETHRFEDRVPVVTGDEVGVLAGSFNMMLDEIERRDAQLVQHRQKLESEVAERSRVNLELRQAKENAEAAVRLKSEFLANMSHEIRTPLNGVTGMISLVLDRCGDTEEREQLRVAQNAAQSLSRLLDDILDLSRLDAGKLALESVNFDLQSMLRECLQIFHLTVRQKNLKMILSVAPDCPAWVRGDPVRLRQILINLVGNAVKFTLAGEVHLSVAPREPGIVEFEVRDTGIGIPKGKLESIFDAFTQADGSHTRRFGGSGLGLTITRRLVNLMGGNLRAESEVGRGSRFLVELPLSASSEGIASGEPSPEAKAPRKDLPPLHVLVAEDNVVNQKVACGMLRRQGWTVTLAANGEQAYRHFLEEHFDLILMDVQMPEVDGLEATDLIRNEERRRALPRTPIIALTAHASQSQHAECLAHGMDAVVTKPIDLTTLISAIGEIVNPSAVA